MLVRVAVFAPVSGTFDYRVNAARLPAIGARVLVPFGRARKMGVVLEHLPHSAVAREKLKSVVEVVDESPVAGPAVLALARRAAAYYRYPLGEVLALAMPASLRKATAQGPATETNYRISEAGRAALGTTTLRAPRQREVLALVASGDFSEQQRSALAFDWRRPLRDLRERGWVEELQTQAAYSPVVPSAATPSPLQLNGAQAEAVSSISEGCDAFVVWLLQGVTGSGKTEVYLRAAQQVLEQGRQLLILVPEIALTEHFVSRVSAATGQPPALYHSGLTESERALTWQASADGRARVVIGTRSAIWLPCRRLGLVVVDEEHDGSYKQAEGMRYSARDVAVMRASLESVPVILGSATPSMESLVNVERGKYRALLLPGRAGAAKPPAMQVVDLRGRKLETSISPELLDAITRRLARGEQSLLFLNRRGYAPTLMCHQCGEAAQCNRCHARLVYHKWRSKLVCHHCGGEQPWRGRLDCCDQPEPIAVGAGTERLEETMRALLPNARIARIDRDSTRSKGSRTRLLKAVLAQEVDVLIGTQMIAKGHHFPAVTLVGIVDADQLLYSADFRAGERFVQQTLQVAGRAGRAEKPGEVLIQTHLPTHPLLRLLLGEGYQACADHILAERRLGAFPPYSAMALIRAEANHVDQATAFLRRCADVLAQAGIRDVSWMGPVPAPMEKRAGMFRWQLLLNASARPRLGQALDVLIDALPSLRESGRVRWSLDVDPLELF
ncbi:MAG: primosomal protein N' [Gammaproteobacteria bacterium]|nr:primosomal protein N' [Gammaproteobacteria bacterium]